METGSGKLIVLDSVDSTNNYAMGIVQQGLAEHGDAWFAMEQTAGKGRMGKAWQTLAGENIIMSMAVKPDLSLQAQFHLSACTAVACHKLLTNYIENVKIKWPNDLYIGDKKAGGILIENVVQGSKWNWAIVGIGINVNQTSFESNLPNPISMAQVTNQNFDVLGLSLELKSFVLHELSSLHVKRSDQLLKYYNEHLYKRGELVTLKKGNSKFQTTVKSISYEGLLMVEDVMKREFGFEEVSWVME